ncbi:MAG TPA: hypothetical protein QF446_01445 [Planctomycetota bacterium]|jgi:hypothetical protein|nr:hypothetical protein [Planctomycetota bacterium]
MAASAFSAGNPEGNDLTQVYVGQANGRQSPVLRLGKAYGLRATRRQLRDTEVAPDGAFNPTRTLPSL